VLYSVELHYYFVVVVSEGMWKMSGRAMLSCSVVRYSKKDKKADILEVLITTKWAKSQKKQCVGVYF